MARIAEKSRKQKDGIEQILVEAYEIARDVGREVEKLLATADDSMSDDAAEALFRAVVSAMAAGAKRRGDRKTATKLTKGAADIVAKMMLARGERKQAGDRAGSAVPEGWSIVTPVQVFHGRRIPLYERRIQTKNIHLWTENERLDVHLEQFKAINGHVPSNDELLDIMHGVLVLPGVTAGEDESSDDQFKIRDLADNIAKNGVRQPPILDSDGVTLLDGNRRVAACYFVLGSDRYNDEEKKQADEIRVWQLTEHADEDDRQAVIVSLNFEPDYKDPWPDYVRAKKVKQAYDSMVLRIGQKNLDVKKDRQIRKDLAKRFALKGSRLGLLLNQMDWVEKFEEYEIDERGKDPHEVKHLAKNKFSYFKELFDIREVLDKDDEYRKLVFDLLFQGKIRNWETVRYLRHQSDQLESDLRRARAEPDSQLGKEQVTLAANAAYQRFRDSKASFGLSERIEAFTEFFEKVPPKTYLDEDALATKDLVALRTLCNMILKTTEVALRAREAPSA